MPDVRQPDTRHHTAATPTVADPPARAITVTRPPRQKSEPGWLDRSVPAWVASGTATNLAAVLLTQIIEPASKLDILIKPARVIVPTFG
jgi:hypothetical protein